jgi:hypothetical protein
VENAGCHFGHTGLARGGDEFAVGFLELSLCLLPFGDVEGHTLSADDFPVGTEHWGSNDLQIDDPAGGIAMLFLAAIGLPISMIA